MGFEESYIIGIVTTHLPNSFTPIFPIGPVRNAAEFAKMINCCGDKIFTALSDPQTKATVDLLNQCDSRDQARAVCPGQKRKPFVLVK
jgi:hypothetical protein